MALAESIPVILSAAKDLAGATKSSGKIGILACAHRTAKKIFRCAQDDSMGRPAPNDFATAVSIMPAALTLPRNIVQCETYCYVSCPAGEQEDRGSAR